MAAGSRAYGDTIARSLGLKDMPALRTRSLTGAQIGITRVSCSAAEAGMTPGVPAEDTFIVALYLTALPHHELWSRGRKAFSQGYRQNAMRIVNLEAEYSALITAAHETIYFYIPRASLDGFAAEAGLPRIANLACEPGLVDPVVANISAALLPAFRAPEQTSTLFLDQMALALCAHAAGRYGANELPRTLLRGRLTLRTERIAKEFMAARLADDVSIADVAAACGLSRGHFLRAFKTTTGTTPHQWLQAYRVERAKALLLDPASSLAEVALKCGFADQSHLTRVFAKITGKPPGAWRREYQGSANPPPF
ncbi:transcriptional regulator [Aliidongia dinghuensis]|uniref:Transcriptional regulator n=2 Tax=Aliidongia dinghuensis TaxID=1867774 RepID=A0A8J3E383_9PROT|nr:transcriptional regulator [Aliidongia dinghuensis]